METNRRWALVTGAASGIGKAIVEHLADNGWGVYATDVDAKGLSAFKNNGSIVAFKVDTTSEPDVRKAVLEIGGSKTGLSALINNAGVFFPGPLADFPQERFERQFVINVFGTQRVTRELFPLILESKGRIINMSSAAGFLATPFSGAYAASKHAIEGWSDSLRRELKPYGIKVIVIQPGLIKTPLWGRDHDERIEQFKNSIFYEANRKKLEHEIGMAEEKGIEPSAVAKTVLESLNAAMPKTRYLVTEKQTQYKLVKLIKLASDGILDAIIHKKMG